MDYLDLLQWPAMAVTVAAAYLVTAAVLGGYAISVFFRWGSERNRPATEAGQDTTT